jgi:hypothetical protein
MKSETKECGICRHEGSVMDCEICDKEVCMDCLKSIDIDLKGFYGFTGEDFTINKIKLCDNCYYKIRKINPVDVRETRDLIKEKAISIIKKNLMVMGLGDEKSEEVMTTVTPLVPRRKRKGRFSKWPKRKRRRKRI